MAEVKCPNCGTVISLEQSDIDSVVQQVRDEEFERELEARMEAAEQEKRQAVELASAHEREQAARAAQEQAARVAELTAQLEAVQSQAAAQLEAARSQAAAELEAARSAAAAQLQAAQAEAEVQMATMHAKLAAAGESSVAKQELAVAQAVAAVEKERDALAAAVEMGKAERDALEARMKEQAAEEGRRHQQALADKDDEIERLRDMRARQSTKMLGETLEIHCQNAFNRVRAMAFPRAYFERDTELAEGTKGDYIFRDYDEDGEEFVSIMFEMKNESDTDSRKLRNEDHFKKLDSDRRKKGCEYAVLVSLLEPDSELYNEGIVDVSYRYEKMFVVRPQFFLAIISLLRAGAAEAHRYRRQIAIMNKQELDISNFEASLEKFKTGFFGNVEKASVRFSEAIAAIDKAIADLQKAKEKLQMSETYLERADKKLEELTVKRLTRGNPTMKAKFAEAAEARAAAALPASEEEQAADADE